MLVLFCCNDYRNGLFEGRFDAIEIGGMRFLKRYDPGTRLVYMPSDEIRIAGKLFPIFWRKDWFGNWCWNAVKMDDQAVIELLNWPRFRGWFDLEEADSELSAMWQRGELFQNYHAPLIADRI